MKRFFLPTTGVAALAALALGALPSQAHGIAAGGAMAGLAHPFLGVDHVLMLLAVGTAASQLSFLLLPWAFGGGLVGALAGNGGGWTVPLLETLAALAIVAVAALSLARSRKESADRSIQLLCGVVVGAGVAIHGLLHGMEAPTDGSRLLWWGGALVSSVALCGGTALLLRWLPQNWGRMLALTILMAGSVLAVSAL